MHCSIKSIDEYFTICCRFTEVKRQLFNEDRVIFKYHGIAAMVNEPWGDKGTEIAHFVRWDGVPPALSLIVMCPTLVERTSGYLMLIKMNDATAASAMEDFSAALNGMPLAMRKSMIYHQGREMARHTEIPQRTDVAIFFCYRTALGSAVATKISTA
jgi:hypothetical protein